MAVINGLTAEAMQEIVDGTVESGSVDGSGHLILTLHDSTTIDAGLVKGAKGDTGDTGADGADGADGTTSPLNTIASVNPTTGDVAMNTHKITGLQAGTTTDHAVNFGQAALKSGTQFSGRNAPAIFSLTFGTTIAVDASLGNYARLTLTASTGTMGAPSNPTDGQPLIFEISQDATGSRTMAWNAAFQFTTALPAPTLTTTASKTDLVMFIYNATKSKWLCVAYVLGHS